MQSNSLNSDVGTHAESDKFLSRALNSIWWSGYWTIAVKLVGGVGAAPVEN